MQKNNNVETLELAFRGAPLALNTVLNSTLSNDLRSNAVRSLLIYLSVIAKEHNLGVTINGTH